MRVLAGYWTHGGYVNWDTGFGFRRWHQAKKLGLSQQALIGIATAPQLAPRPDAPAWANWMLRRGFEFYERQLERSGDTPPALFFGVHAEPQPVENALPRAGADVLQRRAGDRRRARARAVEGAAADVLLRRGHRAARGDDAGLQHGRRPEQPRRVPVRRHRPRAALRRAPGRRRRDRRPAARRVRPARPGHLGPPRVRLPAPRPGPAAADRTLRTACGASASAWTGRAYAGPFQDLRAAGIARSHGWVARTTHRFVYDFAQTSWSLRRAGARGRATVDVVFPSWGGASASVTAVLHDGSSVRVGSSRIPLRRIAHLRIASRYASYVVVPRTRPRGATVHLLRVAAQSVGAAAGPVRRRPARPRGASDVSPLQRPLRPCGARARRPRRGTPGSMSGGTASRDRLSAAAARRAPASPG